MQRPEELQVAAEELYQQTEAIAATRTEVEAERQRYRDLLSSCQMPTW
jgi:hypothetical protein